MIKKILQNEYGLEVIEIKNLDGYDNSNYLIKTANETFIFKTYKFTKAILDLVTAENDALLFLNKSNATNYPKPIPFLDASYVKILEINNELHVCRLLSFLEGNFLGDVDHSESLFESLGAFLADMDLSFKTFESHIIKGRQWQWDIQYVDLNKKYVHAIPSAKDRSVVDYFLLQFEEHVRRVLPELRKQIIHNDANEWNVLVKNNQVSGIIDFGDLAHSLLINELAVAITYACYDKDNPIEWACTILKAYTKKLPLEEKELSILYYLIATRLVISVCNSAHSKKQNPDNAYASVSEIKAWQMLYRWIAISPIYAENSFRKASGYAIVNPKPLNEVVKRRYQHISPILSLSYTEPIYMERSAFQYMYDAYGNTFLDAYNNIPHVGHSHPKVVKVGQAQMAKLNTNTRYLYDQLADYAEKLLAKFPKSLNKVYFVNSGSAASDLAVRLAKAHTNRQTIMVMEHGYHGNTQTSIDVSDYKFNNPKGQGQKDYVLKTKIPDSYRGKYTAEDKNAGKKYADDAINQIDNSESPIAAFMSEPIVGCGGQVPLAVGYLEHLYPALRKHGAICISDEVQTGFGRLGNHFWGFEAHNVVPDMVIIGKPMANGHPMGAVICTDAIAESFGKGVEFFSSFGGNPVSCAIASAVLDVIDEEQLQENARDVGNYYKSLFIELQKTYNCIGDVRGSGLFLGIEIVKDNTLEPDTKLASHIKNELRERHILISTDGPHDSVIKTKPPLIFTKENANMVVNHFEEVLRKYFINQL